jgi:hypothetical protein
MTRQILKESSEYPCDGEPPVRVINSETAREGMTSFGEKNAEHRSHNSAKTALSCSDYRFPQDTKNWPCKGPLEDVLGPIHDCPIDALKLPRRLWAEWIAWHQTVGIDDNPKRRRAIRNGPHHGCEAVAQGAAIIQKSHRVHVLPVIQTLCVQFHFLDYFAIWRVYVTMHSGCIRQLPL